MTTRRLSGPALSAPAAARAVLAPALALALASAGAARAAEIPSAFSGAPLAVRCGKVLDPATRTVRTGVTLHFASGSVTAAAAAAETSLDLSRFTCVPGLVDAHTHLLLQGDPTAAEYDEQVLKESAPYRALRAAAAARAALDHGFTTVRDMGTEGAGFTDVDLAKAFDRGILDGPRVFTSGPAMGVTGGYPLLGYSWELRMPDGVLKCDGADDCRKAVRQQTQHGVEWIKVYADRSYRKNADGSWDSIPNFTLDEMKAIVDEAHRQRRKVASHSMTPSGHRVSLAAGVDSIEHGDVLDDESIRTMAQGKVFYSPTLTALDSVRGPRSKTNPVWDELWKRSGESFRAAMKAGVPIAFGTDAGAFGWRERNAAEEFGLMAGLGMTGWDLLRSATVAPAELLGVTGKLGCLDPGCAADLVAFDGDPLADPKVYLSPKAVLVRGKVVVGP